MKLERYEKYKDSGIEWIGEIPEHWRATRIGSVFLERKEKVSDKEYMPLSVTKQGIVPQLDTAAKTNDGDNRKLVKVGDFVINSRSDRKGSSGLSSLDGAVSLINIVLKPMRDVNGKFIHYLFKSNSFVEEFYRNGHGIVADLWTTRYAEMKTIMMPLPPKEEQVQIADFLDKKTAQIDTAIELQQKQIEKLKEYRASLIDSVVTGKVRVVK
jgi:type I restriction enzyme S subunit